MAYDCACGLVRACHAGRIGLLGWSGGGAMMPDAMARCPGRAHGIAGRADIRLHPFAMMANDPDEDLPAGPAE
ncbi:hypothetical protein [Sphingobium aquiterrae]|uniref:hypothetical protein n=1 Tax=Sphingobium aquiterrae TaxID=2038656 RepID=UPI00301B0404